MVAGIIIVFLIITKVTVLVTLIIIVRLFIVWLQTPLTRVLALRAETSLGLAHLIKFGIIAIVHIILKDLILLVLQVLVLQFLDDLLLLCAPLVVLQIVHVQLILQVVNVSVLFNVSSIEAFQLGLKSLVLFLELGLDVLNALEPLVGTLQLNSAPLDSVLEDGFVASQRLDRLLHLLHFASLSVDDVADALFDVLLLRVLVQVATD